MKKLLGFAAILAALTLTFTGCPSSADDTTPADSTEGTDGLPVVYYDDDYDYFVNYDYYRARNEKYKVIVKDSVTELRNYLFWNNQLLVSIEMPDSVTSIGSWAFLECTSLTSVKLSNSIDCINYQTFKGCTSLTSITIPDSVFRIGMSAFYGCTSLTSITIPDSVTAIDDCAFYGCTGLTSITIPDSNIWIDTGAFSGCTNATVYLPISKKDSLETKFTSCKEIIYY